MKRSIKSVIAATAAMFMCTAPTMATIPFVPAVNTITASAYYTPNAFESFADSWTPEITGLSGVTCNLGHVDYLINFSNNTATIKGIDYADSRIKIPAQLKVSRSTNKNKYFTIKVTEIDNQAFQYKDGMTKDPKNPDRLLMGAPLTKIDLSAAKYLQTIGNNAFKHCTALTSIDIPASVTTINANAFYESGLKSVAFLNTFASSSKTLLIGDSAFGKCTSLRNVLNNVRYFGNSSSNAFNGCSKKLITVKSSYNNSFCTAFKSKFGI